jgi:hypothetical protein
LCGKKVDVGLRKKKGLEAEKERVRGLRTKRVRDLRRDVFGTLE